MLYFGCGFLSLSTPLGFVINGIYRVIIENIDIKRRGIKRHKKRDCSVFHNTKGRPLTLDSVYKMIKRLRNSSGITNLTPHVCRHTFVTRLCEKGVPAKAIAQIIGHAGTGYVLDIYAKLEQKELRKAIYALENNTSEQEIRIAFSEQLYSKLCLSASEKGQTVNEYIFSIIKENIVNS